MIKGGALAAVVVCSVALYPQSPVGWTLKTDRTSEDLARVLSWLPADTETITVARGPFAFATSFLEEDEGKDRTISDEELARSFEELPLAALQFKDGLLAKHLKGKKINLALEGARHFRPPAGLGEMPYEGCVIAVFSDNLGKEIATFARDAQPSALKAERIEGQDVSVFQEKMEDDTWTILVTVPNEHVILVATDRSYLAEVLARLGGKIGERALPGSLPEWKYVNSDARFWGLRHYDKSQAQSDPSSPFGGAKAANFPDEQAIGLAFVFNPQREKSVTVTYLSGNALGASLGDSLLRTPPKTEGPSAKYRKLSPGVVEASYSLEHLQAAESFMLLLASVLGHGVYF